MTAVQRIFHWGDLHHPKWIDIFRIALGIVIFYKGLYFSTHPHSLREVFPNKDELGLWSILLINYISLSHLAGGLFIAFGLITRIAVAFQIPILICAVVLTGNLTGVLNMYSEFGLALIILIFLIVFFIIGSGRFSLDALWERNNS